MKIVTSILITLLIFSSSLAQQKNQDILLIEKLLREKVPEDLLSLWTDTTFINADREFYFRNFGRLVFLTLAELTKFTKERPVEDIIGEETTLYFKEKEGKITANQKEKLLYQYYRDIVMLSNYHGILGNAMVFAASAWRDHHVHLYYRFDRDGNSEGIFLLVLNQASQWPVKLGNNLEEVFGSLEKLRNGFPERHILFQKMEEYHSDNNRQITDFPYGIFPPKDLRDEISGIVPDILTFKNMEMNVLTDSLKAAISAVYLKQGKVLDYNEKNHLRYRNDTDIASFLKSKNAEEFNDQSELRIFLVVYPDPVNIGVALCTPEQARQLHALGVLLADWKVRTDQEDKFMFWTR